MPMEPVELAVAVGWVRLALWALILWSGVQLGAGLYEHRVVIPLWSVSPAPDTLGHRLADSGHTGSSMRFWPFVSPVVFLLAVLNAVLAWRHTGPAQPWWLFSSVLFIVESIATYAYFVPTMLSFMHRADTYTTEQLTRAVSRWCSLSTLRLWAAIPAWLAAVKAVTLLGGRDGWRL
ncbi:Uncharacterized protein OS=Mycobacterium phlei RIVM601174 GN=MPHLEI_00385 PE=4 SV=1 [Gemmata massiliana]|uniref:DUF1772 domain-containing protein n=1 Tax=Gemmata massiliana TaxID=1210884 RepID=A0A6P2CQ44_9BACT|nr:DUF1772 domain-containing protein [Gemmata massiliana]VTR91061.1 Uncharacterized protein OS=Mycobacterium phlei RIVM601174 GN=MPHLEI_00385 PE=4 SV=1 [Gemmata massiliana]